jgi:hypothetical protein
MLTDTFPSAITWEFQNQWEDGWYPRGPSIAEGPEGYAAMLIVGDLWRPMSDPPAADDGVVAEWGDVPGVIRTRNFFTHLDDDLQILGWEECPTPDLPVLYPAVLGVEEPRLYWKDGRWRFTGASRQHHEGGEANVALCVVGSPEAEIIPAPDGVWEKNWMPTETVMVDAIKSDPDHHGGAVVPFDDGFLGVIHEIVDPGARAYQQRFCRYDADGKLVTASKLFKFNANPLQYASGIVFHRGDVVLSWSTQDRVCLLARVPLAEVLATL